MSTKNTNVDIHAQPDGTFHWTKRFEKVLAEFETTNPLEYDYPWQGFRYADNYREFTVHPSYPAENAVYDFSEALLSGKSLDIALWSELLETLFAQPNSSEILKHVFYKFERHYQPHKSPIQLVDMLELYAHAIVAESKKNDGNYMSLPSIFDMYLYFYYELNKIEAYEESEIYQAMLATAKALKQSYPDKKALTDTLDVLFPKAFNLSPNLVNDYLYAYVYQYDFMRFFDDVPVFANIYAYKFCHKLSEPHLIYTVKHHGINVIQLVRSSLPYYRNYMASYNDDIIFAKKYLSKLRQNLRILDAYHHVDVLDFLVEYAYEIEVEKFLNNWIERYPIFTMTRLLENYAQMSAVSLVKKAVHDNPLLIEPLKQGLSDKAQSVLTKMVVDISSEAIEQAKQALKEEQLQQAKTTATSKNIKKKRDKSSSPKVLRFPTLSLECIEATPKVNLDRLNQYEYLGTLQDYENERLLTVLDNPEEVLFNLYRDDVERDIIVNRYQKLTDEQKLLAICMLKPSVIDSDKYEQALQGSYLFTKDDYHFFHTNDSYDSILLIALRKLPSTLKLAIVHHDMPFRMLGVAKSDSALSLLMTLSIHMLLSFDKAVIPIITQFLPDMHLSQTSYIQDKKMAIASAIGNEQSVPYLLSTYKTKTYAHFTKGFFHDFPDALLNAVIYLLFTKQTVPLLKKAKTNARAVFDWLIETDKQAVTAKLKQYDAQLDEPKLELFLEQYNEWQIKTREANANNEAKLAEELLKQSQAVNDAGIPETLLNDDWQKSIRKRNFELSSYINASDLPSLVVEKTGEPLPNEVQLRLLQIFSFSTLEKPMFMLQPNLQNMSKESQTTLANALWEEYMRLDMPKDDKWLMMASGFLYHERLDDKVWRFIKDWESSTRRSSLKTSIAILAQQAISHPNTKASNNALRMLIRISLKARASLRGPAQEQINRYAHVAGLSKEDLADKLIPTLGLDAQGKRVFNFGERQFTMTLDANLKPKFVDNNGKAFKNLPKAGKNDDVDKAKQAHAELKDLKKQLKEFIRDDVPRMENMMITQRRLNFANFKAFYVNNPLMLRYSYQLVWGVFDKDNTDKLIQPFRVVETGEILDINDDDLTISDDAFIGLVHPIQLTEEQKQQLSQSLQDDEIIQPFAQLARPVYQLTANEQKNQTITRFNDERFATGSLIGFKNKGWEPYQIGGGYCEGYSKTVNGHELFFQFTGFGIWEGVPADDKGQELQPIQLNKKMSDIDISEFIYVLDSMARLG